MRKILLAVISIIVLTACDKEESVDMDLTNKVIEEGTVGFEIAGGTIEEATGVPEQEKKRIIATFEQYIEAFNNKDIERYAATLSKHAKGFDYEEDVNEAQKAFDTYNIERVAEDITIVKYLGEEAHVFANLSIETVEMATNTKLSSNGRQVTVFIKEDNDWKVSSVYYIGNE